MGIMRGYGLGPNFQRLIQRFWDEQAVVPNVGRFYGRPFRTERRVTQGDPILPKVFNIVVGAVVREVRLEVCGNQEAQHGLV